jgi:hypothetical protein
VIKKTHSSEGTSAALQSKNKEELLYINLLRIFETILNYFIIIYNNFGFNLTTAFAYYRNIDPTDPLK